MDLLTIAEVSAMTRVPVATLRYWRHLGNTGRRSFTLGPKKVVYRQSDVEAWINEQYNQSAGVA